MEYSPFQKIIDEAITKLSPREIELAKEILKEPISFEEKLGVLYLLGENKIPEKILNLIKSLRELQQRKISSTTFISFLQKEFNFTKEKAKQLLREIQREFISEKEIPKEEKEREIKDIYREPIE